MTEGKVVKEAKLLRIIQPVREHSVYTGQFFLTPGLNYLDDKGGKQVTNFVIASAWISQDESLSRSERRHVFCYPCDSFAAPLLKTPLYGSLVGTTSVVTLFKTLGYEVRQFSEKVLQTMRRMYDVDSNDKVAESALARDVRITRELAKKYRFADDSYSRTPIDSQDSEYAFRLSRGTIVVFRGTRWSVANLKNGIYQGLSTYEWLEDALIEATKRYQIEHGKKTVKVAERTETAIDTSNVIDAELILPK